MDRFLYDAGNLENRIPWISPYLAGSMTLTDGFSGQETPLSHSLAWDLDFTKPKLTHLQLGPGYQWSAPF